MYHCFSQMQPCCQKPKKPCFCVSCHGRLFAGEVYYDILGEFFCDSCATVAARRSLHRFRRQMPIEVMK